MANYAVMRTDKMHGTTDLSSLVNVKISEDLQNGTIVKLGALATGEREAYVATKASASDALKDVAILCGPELMYDERKKNLHEYINEVAINGGIYRAFKFFSGDEFSLTKEAFVTAPTSADIGSAVALGADGKVEVGGSGTAFGKLIAVEGEFFVLQEIF